MNTETKRKVKVQAAWREQARRELLATRNLPIEDKLRLVEQMGEFVELLKSAKTIHRVAPGEAAEVPTPRSG